jgi:hypothetical protein
MFDRFSTGTVDAQGLWLAGTVDAQGLWLEQAPAPVVCLDPGELHGHSIYTSHVLGLV